MINFPDFEILTSILSVLKWQEHNGPVKLITDTQGALFFQYLGMGELWDEIDVSLDRIPSDIDPFLFWAAGKLYALQTMDLPCVMLDTDLIVWKKLADLEKYELITAHAEGLNPYVYPHHSIFQLQNDYQFPKEWDFSLDAANTAFLYIKDSAFRDYYVEQALSFFRNVGTDGLNPVTAMCFAEQRILPMCAAAKNVPITYILNLNQPNAQDLLTHTWGFKQIMRERPEVREDFCRRCIERIRKDFPERESLLINNPVLKKYTHKPTF